MRVVQIQHTRVGRKVAVVEEEKLRLVQDYTTLYACALAALEQGIALESLLSSSLSDTVLDYEALYAGSSEWQLLPPFDHPTEPARCLVTGTGLTHSKGAANRDAMHKGEPNATPVVTDSMKIYQWGVEGGRPAPGNLGVQPEWFYKGTGTILRGHGEPLDVPNFADDGGEEPELVGIYLINASGQPHRLGFAQGNEFSDHQMERKNYLYLAPSKLRTCSIGPEIVLGGSFEDVTGTVAIQRQGEVLWSHPIATGEANMVHSLANLEYHHFKYPSHRQAGDVHLHFFGTGAFSFGAGIVLEEGDEMMVTMEGYGKPLRNPIRIDSTSPQWVPIHPL